MRNLLFILFVFFAISSNAQNWNLIWSDEFNGTNLDNSKWTHDIGTGSLQGLWGWGNGELQFYQPDNTSLSNGKLLIEAREEPQGITDSWNNTKYYSSSKIKTAGKFNFRYGKVEARMKTVDGEGFWPAFWMLQEDGCWPLSGEIDIMEQWGSDLPTNQTTGAAHVGYECGANNTYQSWNTTIDGSFADDFHVYSVIWYEDYIGWYLDDELQYFITPSSYGDNLYWPFNEGDWYIMINFAIDNGGPNSNTAFPSNIEVDYVRVYQTQDIQGCMDNNATNYNDQATLDDNSCIYEVTFNVNMNCSDENHETVYVSGGFNNWCGTCHPLSDDNGDGIWSGSYAFDQQVIDYKYTIDNWTTQENLIDDMQNGANCAPVTDYYNYANRQVSTAQGAVTVNDVYGQCEPCDQGCNDPIVHFSIDLDGPLPSGYSNVVVNGSWNNWQGWGVVLQDNDGDYVWEGTSTFDIGESEYVFAYTGEADGWSGWGVVGNAPIGSFCDYNPSDDYGNYGFNVICNSEIFQPTVCFNSCEPCAPEVLGCTFPNADNYNPDATQDDGSCTFCGEFSAVLIAASDVTEFGANDGYIYATGQNGSSNYDLQVTDADGVAQNPFALAAGDYIVTVVDLSNNCSDSFTQTISEPVVAENPCDIVPTGLFVDDIIHERVRFNWDAPSASPHHYMIRYRPVGTSSWTVMSAGPINTNDFNGTSRTRYFMEPGTTYQWNIRARMLNEDLSIDCQSAWSASSEYTTLPACANLENLSVVTEATWVDFYADAPAAEWGVWDSKGKLREVGSNNYRYVTGGADGIDFRKGNFNPSTENEWHTKAWCTGNVDENGNSDPQYHSGWGDFSTFTTEAPCDKMPTNLTSEAGNNAQTAIKMNWDTPESGAPDHYFLELTNETTGQVFQWNNIAGSATSKIKYGQNVGDQFSWRIRGACGPIGTSWATIFSQPVTYTLGGEREAMNIVADLDVYPNPTNGTFILKGNIISTDGIIIEISDVLGQVIYTMPIDSSTEFINERISLVNASKGLYFLKFNGVILDKIIVN